VTRSALPRIGLLALIWGSAFLWIKLADRGFSPVEVTLARLALGAMVLFAIVLARRRRSRTQDGCGRTSRWRRCSPMQCHI
jgi:drug/metabolite transporter (DMT)-like permease